jgi:hypothetical protein
MVMRCRLVPVVVAPAVLAVACGGDESVVAAVGTDASVTGPEHGVAQIASSPREDVPSALDEPAQDAFPDPLIDLSRVRSGGPPPDGIRSRC